MQQFIILAKKYGGLGVVSMWLFLTNSRVDKLEVQLAECNESKINIFRELTKKNEVPRQPYSAIITNQLIIKKEENEKC